MSTLRRTTVLSFTFLLFASSALAQPPLRCGHDIQLGEHRGELPATGLRHTPYGVAKAPASIVLQAGTMLQNNPTMLAAWEAAADIWESWLDDGVVITIDADIAALGEGVLGETTPEVFVADYALFRDAMVADALAGEELATELPDSSQINLILPPLFTYPDQLTATKANLRALGFDMSFDPDPDAVMRFNSNLVAQLDFDPSDGIDPAQYDFEAIVIHEMGHVLGFMSEVDNVDFLRWLGFPSPVVPRTLDLFRFRPGDGPADFTLSPRLLSSGDVEADQVLFLGGQELPMATGAYVGDGYQASHWKADEVAGPYLGIMDPTIAPGDRQQLTANDLRAFGLIGWDVARDCNENGVPDPIDISSGTSQDLDLDGVPDECIVDCNGNGTEDSLDIFGGTSLDCNGNGVPDECEVVFGDCNANGIPDECDISSGTSEDVNGNGVPDECEPFALPAEPTITSIVDVANDQGRQVRLTFDASNQDAPGSPTPITEYEVLRRVDALPGKLPGWDFLGTVPAHGESGYAVIVPTLADSTEAHGIHWSVYRVRAATSDAYTFFDSAPDSGYSIDDLAPAAPQALVISQQGSATALVWEASPEPDLQCYRIYRAGGLVAETADPFWTDASAEAGGFDYAVSAVDWAGNESPAATPESVTAAPSAWAGYRLEQNEPNPFNPSTVLRFSLPRPGAAWLRIFDVAGREVRSFDLGSLSPEDHEVFWDGRDRAGRPVASGVYVYRLEASGWSQSRRMVLLK